MGANLDSDGTPLNCIAFHKGDLVPDWVLEHIVDAATRGHITEAGRKLWLIPINVNEQAKRDQQAKADREAKRRRRRKLDCKPGPASPSIKKSDCIPLSSFLPKRRGAKYCDNRCRQAAYRLRAHK